MTDLEIRKEDRHVRLDRWAALLERDPCQTIGLLSPSWAGGDQRGPLIPSAIDVAWEDPILRVMGLKSRARGDVKAFFGLSDAELDRIVSGSWRVPMRPAWQVAARIRNVGDPRVERLVLASVTAIILVFVAVVEWLR
ncbi:hypothetical protein [Erythrobacter sp. SG61-1L]|uniref:hypothetical protein n=1 Tax=Erythrobacter sp. SG61-1L TaxID=1603897 RepID=UPI001F516B0D|nr:hypothetical protein [Erythrobacter sp. SG61-1L]